MPNLIHYRYQVHDRLTLVKGATLGGATSQIPFGGTPMLSVGDPYQLGPICDTALWEQPAINEPADFAKYMLLWKPFQCHELTEIVRQEDKSFAGILNKIRTCGPGGIQENSEEDKVLQSRELKVPETDPNYPSDLLHVYAKREDAEKRNRRKLAELEGQTYTSIAKYSTNSKFSDHTIPVDDSRETGNLVHKLDIKIGARVKMPINVNNLDGLTNGATGTVVHVILKANGTEMETIMVKFDNPKIGVQTRQESKVPKRRDKSVPITKVEGTFFLGKRKNIEYHNWQFPLVLCWGSTIHVTQSLSLSGIVVDMTNGRYLPGQAYVAFSRVRNLDQLWIINYDRQKVKSSPIVDAEMERLRKNPIPTLPQPVVLNDSTVCSIGHLNIRSLMSKVKYLKNDPVFQCSILCISETRLSDQIPTKKLPWPDNFTVERNDRNRDGGGVLIAANPCTQPIPVALPTSSLEIVGVKIHIPQEVLVLCVYRSRDLPKDEFVVQMEKILSQFTEMGVVVIGDFNEDVVKLYYSFFSEHSYLPLNTGQKSHKLHDFMLSIGFTQVIKEPTHEEGSLLDHIYLRNTDFNQSDVQDIYFSDHSAIYCVKSQS